MLRRGFTFFAMLAASYSGGLPIVAEEPTPAPPPAELSREITELSNFAPFEIAESLKSQPSLDKSPRQRQDLKEGEDLELDLAAPNLLRLGSFGTPSITSISQIAEGDLSVEMRRLRSKVQHCLKTYYSEPISVADHSPWGIMHALIAYGVDAEVQANGRPINAIGHLCFNRPCRGMQLMKLDKQNRIHVEIGPGYQGHSGQFLAMLAQSRVKPDFPIRIAGRELTVADLITSEKLGCRARTELTFKLIALSHYLPIDAAWKNDLGEQWSIARLIKEELAQSVVGSACGGTHRMTGFSYSVNKILKTDAEFEGQFLRARTFVDSYHKYIFKLQNSDGSFSTNWFEGRGDSADANRRVQTTGHMLEWLVCSLPADELQDPRVISAVDYLTDLLLQLAAKQQKLEIGPRGHALHGLSIYAERVFGDLPGERDAVLARRVPPPNGRSNPQ